MSTVDTMRSRVAEAIDPASRRRRMYALIMLVASVVLILLALAVAVVSTRFGEDKPYPADNVPNVPDQRGHNPDSRP